MLSSALGGRHEAQHPGGDGHRRHLAARELEHVGLDAVRKDDAAIATARARGLDPEAPIRGTTRTPAEAPVLIARVAACRDDDVIPKSEAPEGLDTGAVAGAVWQPAAPIDDDSSIPATQASNWLEEWPCG